MNDNKQYELVIVHGTEPPKQQPRAWLSWLLLIVLCWPMLPAWAYMVYVVFWSRQPIEDLGACFLFGCLSAQLLWPYLLHWRWKDA